MDGRIKGWIWVDVCADMRIEWSVDGWNGERMDGIMKDRI